MYNNLYDLIISIPAFALWGAAYPLYQYVYRRKAEKVDPLIEAKREEAEQVCEKEHALL